MRKTKAQKRTRIVFLSIFAVVFLLFIIRAVNSFRYPAASTDSNAGFVAHDMETYPLEQDGVTVNVIRDGTLNGFHIIPSHKRGDGLIVTFGGSEGGCGYERAIGLGQWGYEVAALFYYGQDDQPQQLDCVPIDFFSEFLAYAKTHHLSLEPLTVLGGSKGAELALVLAQQFEEIDNLVLYAPSSYIFQGMDFQNAASSWTYMGDELPFIAYKDASLSASISMFSAMLLRYPMTLRPIYETAIENSETAAGARIVLENLDGHILLFAGSDDKLWPSDRMAAEIAHTLPEQTELNVYQDAGHNFYLAGSAGNIRLGGTEKANEQARRHSDERLKRFLQNHH